MDIPAERRVRILERLHQKGIVRVDELGRELEVSVITVRRDLALMEAEGLLERTRGGAISSHVMRCEPSYRDKGQIHIPGKTVIAQKAASLIEPGETLFAGSGSTTALVLQRLSGIPGLTVITNNVGALSSLEGLGNFKEVILAGGTLRRETSCVVGEETLACLGRSFPSTTVIGLDGISFRRGLTSHNIHEAGVCRKMIEQTSGRIIAVADSSKIGLVSMHFIGELSALDILITDALPDLSMEEDFKAAGVELLLVGAP